jgi:dGTPase
MARTHASGRKTSPKSPIRTASPKRVAGAPFVLSPDVASGNLPLYSFRRRRSSVARDWKVEDFYSDKSRIVFCSSFRRLMQKAQVFSIEANPSVRNRLTHTIEVADIGRTLARHVGKGLQSARLASEEEVECIETIVESACLLHDIGNPAFGHFGEEAIKKWFHDHGPEVLLQGRDELALNFNEEVRLSDFRQFDGNAQTFRIATKLHSEIDEFGLNLTASALLASVKYPNCGRIEPDARFPKKLGVFFSEKDIYEEISEVAELGRDCRYFLAYLMELADDICYCLSDIADSFEKGVTNSREFKDEFRKICRENGVDEKRFIPEEPISNFAYQVSIRVAQRLIKEAATEFLKSFSLYLSGTAPEMAEALPSGRILKCFKMFTRRFIYTNREAQRIEIAGATVVDGLLKHFGRLLPLTRDEFTHFIEKGDVLKRRGFDTEWRIFNQLSPRMLRVYRRDVRGCFETEERICRARLIVDHISGMTDNSALEAYRNFMGISL